MLVSHIGSISSNNISLGNTYRVPKFSHSLISVGQLCEKNYNNFYPLRATFLLFVYSRNI
jgi:hypothetical protein